MQSESVAIRWEGRQDSRAWNTSSGRDRKRRVKILALVGVDEERAVGDDSSITVRAQDLPLVQRFRVAKAMLREKQAREKAAATG